MKKRGECSSRFLFELTLLLIIGCSFGFYIVYLQGKEKYQHVNKSAKSYVFLADVYLYLRIFV